MARILAMRSTAFRRDAATQPPNAASHGAGYRPSDALRGCRLGATVDPKRGVAVVPTGTFPCGAPSVAAATTNDVLGAVTELPCVQHNAINSEQRWSVYKETVAGSQDKALELFATKTVDARIELDLNRPSSPVRERSPPPMSQEEATQSPIVQSPIAQQPPLDNEYDEHDDGDDGFEMNGNNIGDLDKYWTQEEMDHSIPYSRCYASDSDDDGPEEEVDEDGLTAKEAERAEIFKKVTGRDIRVPLFRDVSLADGAVVDGGKSFLLGARPISKRDVDATTAMISKGLTFDTFLELKIWLKEFSIKHHRPYIFVHSDLKKRYTLKCVDKRCPWVVRARPFKKGPSWHITSCVATHMCRVPKLDGKDSQPDHRQLTSEFIAYKLSAEISSLPIMSIKSVQDTVKSRFAYDVKYGKAWKAKQAAFKMLYGDWEEAYNRVPRLLLAMAATNPGMVHVVEPSATKMTLHDGKRVRVFHRAFWSFEQCTRAFEHCRPVIAVDGTFLTGQYKDTLLVATANDASNRLVPLAFALVEIENNDNWEWFFHILRTRVIPPSKEVCVISDRHQGILNAVELAIPGHAPLHHRWCMRHFCANFYRACKSKELSDLLQDCCLAYLECRFANLYNGLLKHKDLNVGGQEFLHRHLIFNSKWARAYDEDGRRYGQMTSNMAECFNNVLKGVRALPVTAIIQYTFEKLNVYFQNYTDETEKEIANNCEFPTKVQEFMDFQARKADSQTATCYDNVDWVYQVNEPGGTTQGSAHLAKNQRAMMLAQVKHQVANKLQINLEANKPQANKPQANKVQANRLRVNLLQANKLQAHKPHGNKLHGNKLQAHKPHGNKLQRNKLQVNKLQGNKPHGNKLHGNKLQGNKPQGIKHNGDKVQGFTLGLVEVSMVAVGVLA
ncbi:hypothetical protein QYE76_007083 [Lolium multiflorum]|uniref:Uncharacterized protein n=1 Tax=Lolium multiflorum TaxID=4521 RepID=A0AAD8RWZ4_LOLMU|nr:hypothetical protein QYE76_007083 [Lolium multiflorum]